MLIALENICKTYPMGAVTVDALKGISLDIEKGSFIAVAGASGSGKTTLMNIIGLIDKPTSGALLINDKETGLLSREEIVRMRQETIGFIFQSFNLLPVLDVFENVELPMIIRKDSGSKAERRERVESLVEEVGLADRMRHMPAELSGGEQQRVAIARALVNRPQIIIADEPTANLDSENGRRVLELLQKVQKNEGTTLIISTHDPDIWKIAQTIVHLRDGAIVSEERH
ncbi:MAG: ABC transporter ATP-binding protein [Treponema sp.]|jgi:putative ABC transport system ATP-binding protein|nr:ABC transporter ATP-binding protein [Treponema sp.]